MLLPFHLYLMMPSLPAAVAAAFSAAKLALLLLPLLLLLLTALPPLPTALPQLPYEFSIILFLSNFTHLFLLFYPHHQELIGCDYGGLLSYFLHWSWHRCRRRCCCCRCCWRRCRRHRCRSCRMNFLLFFLSNFTHLFLLFYPHRQEMIGCDYGGGVLLLAWFGWVAELFAAGCGLPWGNLVVWWAFNRWWFGMVLMALGSGVGEISI